MIASAILGLAGTAASGLMSYFNNKRMQRQADAEAARQEAYYTAHANENPLSRSENQHILGQYDRDSQRQIENARGVAAITGGTSESGAAVQKAVAEGRADLMGSMSAGSSRRADYFNQKGEEARHQKAIDDQERLAARNETFANLAANAANAVGGVIDSYSGGASKAPKSVPSGVTPQDQQKINQSLAQVNHQVKADKGLLTNPGIAYEQLRKSPFELLPS